MNTAYRMRMLAAHRRRLRELLSDTNREQACFLVCSKAQGQDETILLVREVIALEPDDLRIHAPDQLSVAPEAMLRIARQAQKLRGSICMVHTHPMCSGAVGFSAADDFGNVRTFEFFSRMLPGEPNSCLVWDGQLNCVAGRVYHAANSWSNIDGVEVVSGETRTVHHARHLHAGPTILQYDRQARLLGREGQQAVQRTRIAVIGCGGIGSVVAMVLAHSGVTNLALIDFDHIETTNLPRVVGATPTDATGRAKKTEVVRRYVLAHSPLAHIDCYESAVESENTRRILVSCDVVVCCTDDTTSRAYLNQICHQYYVPILDLGVQFASDEATGKLVKEIGRVHLMMPGTPCLCCTGHVDARRLAEEGLSDPDRQQRLADGYVTGTDVHEPSMMVFNMQVASRGVQRVIEWVTGLNSVDGHSFEHFRFLGINAATGIKSVRKRGDPACPFCGGHSALVGRGDAQPMLVRPRERAAA